MERPVLRSDWNIWDHLWRWSSLTGRSGPNETCRSIYKNSRFQSHFTVILPKFRSKRKWNASVRLEINFWWKKFVPFFLAWLVPLVSDLMIRHNGKHPITDHKDFLINDLFWFIILVISVIFPWLLVFEFKIFVTAMFYHIFSSITSTSIYYIYIYVHRSNSM